MLHHFHQCWFWPREARCVRCMHWHPGASWRSSLCHRLDQRSRHHHHLNVLSHVPWPLHAARAVCKSGWKKPFKRSTPAHFGSTARRHDSSARVERCFCSSCARARRLSSKQRRCPRMTAHWRGWKKPSAFHVSRAIFKQNFISQN